MKKKIPKSRNLNYKDLWKCKGARHKSKKDYKRMNKSEAKKLSSDFLFMGCVF